MNWMDLVLLSLLALGTALGAKSGLVWQVGKLVAIVVAVVGTAWLHEPVGAWLATFLANDVGARLLSYTLTFTVAYGIVWTITALIEWKVRKVAALKVTDRILGGAVGFAKTGLVLGAVLMGFAVYAILPVEEPMSESFMAKYLVLGMQQVVVLVPDHYRQDLSEFTDRAYDYAKNKAADQTKEAWDKLREKTIGAPQKK